MALPLDEHYLRWLYSKVMPVLERDRSKTYWWIVKQMHSKEFVWFIPNDDNRLEDGRLLRYDFLAEEELEPDKAWMDLGCSFLEFLVALVKRLSFEDGRSTNEWFSELLFNLGLRDHTDEHPLYREELDAIMDNVIWRNYSETGTGGLFPLNQPQRDQRKVEIWYQLSEYLIENE